VSEYDEYDKYHQCVGNHEDEDELKGGILTFWVMDPARARYVTSERGGGKAGRARMVGAVVPQPPPLKEDWGMGMKPGEAGGWG
jgi:hypothetical protein